MLSRIIAGMIVVFWVGMMTALVRVELFPDTGRVGDVPPEIILRKIFTLGEDTRLNVSYQGRNIGFCRIEIEPLASDHDSALAADGYRVRSDLTLALELMGAQSHLRLAGDSLFNTDYEIESFRLKTEIGEGRVDVRGDSQSNLVTVDFEFGDIRDRRVFNFDQIQGAGLASAMGLPGLANFSFLGGGGMPGTFGSGSGAAEAIMGSTTIHLAELRVGSLILKSYLVESRLDQNLWARIWVSERGEVLKVDTSFGLSMLADVLSGQDFGPAIGTDS